MWVLKLVKVIFVNILVISRVFLILCLSQKTTEVLTGALRVLTDKVHCEIKCTVMKCADKLHS